jgi:hypothetical protein
VQVQAVIKKIVARKKKVVARMTSTRPIILEQAAAADF